MTRSKITDFDFSFSFFDSLRLGLDSVLSSLETPTLADDVGVDGEDARVSVFFCSNK
jgi:hypothetical protein